MDASPTRLAVNSIARTSKVSASMPKWTLRHNLGRDAPCLGSVANSGRRQAAVSNRLLASHTRPKAQCTKLTSPATPGRYRKREPWPFLSARMTSKPLMVAKAVGRFDQALELAAVGLKVVAQILDLSVLGLRAELALLLQGRNGQTVGRRLFGVDHGGPLRGSRP